MEPEAGKGAWLLTGVCMTWLSIVMRLPGVWLQLSNASAPLTWVTRCARVSACHVQATPVGPTAPVYVAAVVTAGPGSSAYGVGPMPCPADPHPPRDHQALALGSAKPFIYL